MLLMHVQDNNLLIDWHENLDAAKGNVSGLFYKVSADNWVSEEFLREVYNTRSYNIPGSSIEESALWSNATNIDRSICSVCSKKISCMFDKIFEQRDAWMPVQCKVPSLKSKPAHIDKPLITIPIVPADNGMKGIMLQDYAEALTKLADGTLKNVLFWQYMPGAKPRDGIKDVAQDILLLLNMNWQHLYKSKQYHPKKDIVYLRALSSAMPTVQNEYKSKRVHLLSHQTFVIDSYKVFD